MFEPRDISAADQQQLGLALAGRGSINAPLPFSAGLAAQETFGAFAWRDLPGMHTREEFKAVNWFRALTTDYTANLSGATFGSAHSGAMCFTVGSTGYRNDATEALDGTATGCHQGLLGSVFTTGTSLYIASDTETTAVWTPDHMGGITKPCEINGFVFFTACLDGNVEVVGYVPPPLIIYDGTRGTGNTNERPIEYFATEHLGTSARVGLWQGRIVVATSRGIWEIKPADDGQGYALGSQIESWGLSPEVQFAITHDDVWALDQGVLLRRGQSAEMIGNCGFTVLTGDGRTAVLSEPGGRFAVSNGTDFEEFGGDQRAVVVGTLLVTGGDTPYSVERAAFSGVDTVWLTTTWACFPNSVAIEELYLHPSVRAVKVLTETATLDLMRSSVAPSLWRAGCGGTRLKLMIEVPVGEAITAPVLKLRRRTAA